MTKLIKKLKDIEKTEKKRKNDAQVGWRRPFSIILGIGWLGFAIVWLLFYADAYSFLRNLAIILASILLCGGIVGAIWVSFGTRVEHPLIPPEAEMFVPNVPQIRWRLVLTILSGVGWLFSLLLWYVFFSGDYTLNKNISIFFLSLFGLGIILSLIWISFGRFEYAKIAKIFIEPLEFGWRLVLSIILVIGVLLFLAIWFWFFADTLHLFLNLLLAILVLVVSSVIIAWVWVSIGHQFPDYKQIKE